jgi:hypothetical protein
VHSQGHDSGNVEKGEIKLNCHNDLLLVLNGIVWLQREEYIKPKGTLRERGLYESEDSDPPMKIKRTFKKLMNHIGDRLKTSYFSKLEEQMKDKKGEEYKTAKKKLKELR